MIKRILRYPFLILALLLLAAWGWSCVGWGSATYRAGPGSREAWVGQIWQGRLRGMHYLGMPEALTAWLEVTGDEGVEWGGGLSVVPLGLADRLGLVWPSYNDYLWPDMRVKTLTIPLWVIATPALLATLWAWWPWLRERRNRNRVGFEVETR